MLLKILYLTKKSRQCIVIDLNGDLISKKIPIE
jgi:hypothetical protein